MRIAVTGTTGQVALCLAEAAAAMRGVEVVLIGRPALDLARTDTVLPALAAARPDVVVNAAAYTLVDKAESEPALAHAINADGARAVAIACAALDVPLIQISTDYVFAGTGTVAYVETDPTGPVGVYGATKYAGEQAVAAAARST